MGGQEVSHTNRGPYCRGWELGKDGPKVAKKGGLRYEDSSICAAEGVRRVGRGMDEIDRWSVDKSRELYAIREWGRDYFDISDEGHVIVRPNSQMDVGVDLFDLVHTLERRGVELPIILRFNDIIRSQITRIHSAFDEAIKKYSYGSSYRLAFPIKVNQQRHVIEAVQKAGREYGVALEVGSKPELIAVLAVHDVPDAVFLCNGYKDSEYIELALMARKLGRRSIIIVEQFHELDTVLSMAEQLGVQPEVGLRMKPLSRSAGKWEASSGANAKFGLSSLQIMRAVEELERRGASSCLKLLHYHVGSQISSILAVKRVLREATRVYAEIKALNPSLSILDVGGGLAVDYDGSKTSFQFSMDYTVEEYARDVVWAVHTMCEEEGIEAPEIMSESGRATVAHHAVLVTSVTDVAIGRPPALEVQIGEETHRLVKELRSVYEEMSAKNFIEGFHDALGLREEILNAFLQKDLSLQERAQGEELFRAAIARARELSLGAKKIPEELEKIDKALRDLYFCNFSLFQSIPDSWAIDQLFPIIPLHRLTEKPTRKAMIADLTCDSDGKIDQFIDIHDVRSELPLHEVRESENYYLGVFLVGAYQEILGDLHNLFGDTNAVHIEINAQGQIEVKDIVEGDTVREVLSYVQFEPGELVERFRRSLEESLSAGKITPEEVRELMRKFRQSLDGYTYLVK